MNKDNTEESLKEKYWHTGNILEFNTGKKKLIWNDHAIDNGGYLPKNLFNDNLVNTNSTVAECVIRIYGPNKNAYYFKDLTKTKQENLLWQMSDYIFTEKEVREKLGIPENEKFFIVR